MDWSISSIGIFSTKLRTDALEAFRQVKILFVANYHLTRIITLIGFAFLIRSLQQEEQVKTLELNYLKAQLQPHFFLYPAEDKKRQLSDPHDNAAVSLV